MQMRDNTSALCFMQSLFRTRWLHREEYRSARHRPMRLPFMGVPPHPLHRGSTRPPGTPFIIGTRLHLVHHHIPSTAKRHHNRLPPTEAAL